MIEFRQKVFHVGTAGRVAFRAKQVTSKAKTAIKKTGNKLKKALTADPLKRNVLEMEGNYMPKKSKHQLLREAVKADTQAKILLYEGPGEVVANGVGKFIKDPALATAAATTPIPGAPTFTVLVPAARGIAENETYKKITGKVYKGYIKPRGKHGHSIEDYVKAGVNNLKNLPV